MLAGVFGDDVSFVDQSLGLPGVQRSFDSFSMAAAEAGRSRIYGGIHFEFSNQDGSQAGRELAAYVMQTFATEDDTQPPRIILDSRSGAVFGDNVEVDGQVLDNLSGVSSLEVSIDQGDSFALAFDERGRFSIIPNLQLDGSSDGLHHLTLVATDAQGNESEPLDYLFTLDTRAPQIEIDSPSLNANLDSQSRLRGTARSTGSSIVQLAYQFSGQPRVPVPFEPVTGSFDVSLNLSRLPAGSTTLTVFTMDAAGHTASVDRNLTLTERIPFEVERLLPVSGAFDVGSTFRPQVFFSRPVNPQTLTSSNFYASGPNGQKLDATIVPAEDGSFAWLFLDQPMPGRSRITVTVSGSTILAAGDGVALDGDRDGVPGGTMSYSFSTVSLTPLIGTSLSGKVVDPGADLKPMTRDDLLAGPDQRQHTADDIFLLPIVGVKVFIVGLENQAVFTDAEGNFSFASVPAGNVKLAVDGRTASNSPTGVYFPEMVMDLNLEPGRANTVMGSMGSLEEQKANRDRQELYLPRVPNSILQSVDGSTTTMIGVDAVAAPNLTANQRANLSIEVQPGSLRDQQGNLLGTGQVGISTVPPELVREMLPPGLLQHTFDITVQAPGISNFSAPAPMTFPNTFAAPAGTQLNFLSFDHTTGRLVIEGTATVSADGSSVRTDPGTGITHPGWHGLTPQGSDTQPNSCDVSGIDLIEDEAAPILGTSTSGQASFAAPAKPQLLLSGHDKDYLFTNDRDGEEALTFLVTEPESCAKIVPSKLRSR